MATVKLDRLSFFFREKKNPATGTAYEMMGFFSCRRNVAAFFDIESLASNRPVETVKTKAYKRKTAIVGGALDKAGGVAATEIDVAGSQRGISNRTKGSRTVRLTTGKLIEGRKASYNTVSFRFPGWTTIPGIADALGEILPPQKISATPTATEVKPEFTVIGGRTYSLMTKAVADARIGVEVPATPQEAQAMADAHDAKDNPTPP